MNEDRIRALLSKRMEWELELILKAWEDEDFQKRLVEDPHAVIGEHLGQDIPGSVKINVHEDEPGEITLVVPVKPKMAESSEELTEQDLDKVAGGIGVAAGVSSEDIVAITII